LVSEGGVAISTSLADPILLFGNRKKSLFLSMGVFGMAALGVFDFQKQTGDFG